MCLHSKGKFSLLPESRPGTAPATLKISRTNSGVHQCRETTELKLWCFLLYFCWQWLLELKESPLKESPPVRITPKVILKVAKVATQGHPQSCWMMGRWSKWKTWRSAKLSKSLIQKANRGRASLLAGWKSIDSTPISSNWQPSLEMFSPWQVDCLLPHQWYGYSLGNHGLFIWKSGSMSATFARNLSVGDILVVSETSNNTQVNLFGRFLKCLLCNTHTHAGWKAGKHLRCHWGWGSGTTHRVWHYQCQQHLHILL